MFDIHSSAIRVFDAGLDQRLDRMMEVATMIMEALIGFDAKYQWSIVGHSGDGHVLKETYFLLSFEFIFLQALPSPWFHF